MINNTIISSLNTIRKIIYNNYLPTIVFDNNYIINCTSKHFSDEDKNKLDNILEQLNINSYWKHKIIETVKKRQNLEIPIRYNNNGKNDCYYIYIDPLIINKYEKYFMIQFEDVEVLYNININFDSVVHKLKQSNKELEQFAYVASHDLQEPLRTVSSYCQLIESKYKDKIDDDGKKYINYVISATYRMKNLINELLDFSKVGKNNNNDDIIDLNKIIKEIKKDFKVSIQEYNIKMKYFKLPTIKGSRYRIKQLFQNLISNAIKFRKDDNNVIIQIGYFEYLTHWEFFVKDNGIGISEKYQEKIFGLFKRLYTKEEYPGTGIGLAICKKIVEKHNGKIWIESEPNDGTTIFFNISKNI